jgi:hypothetical protein
VSVIFALVFLIVVSIVLTGVLGFAFAASRNVTAYERDEALRNAADAALESAVQLVKVNPELGITKTLPNTPTPGDCAMMLRVDGATDGNTVFDPANVFSATARLHVLCEVTPGVALSGEVDGDGNQGLRDVTFRVVCRTPASSTGDVMDCGGGSNEVVLGRARVRFDVDPGHTPASERARVPKVITWDVDR